MSIELTNMEASRMYELLAESERLHTRIAELERALKMAGDFLEEQGRRLEDIAGGIDYEADPNNASPEDGDQHLGGLIWHDIQKKITEIKAVLGE